MPYAAYSLMAKPGITKISDLAGKTISIGGAKDITRVFLEQMLDSNRLTTRHYDLVYAGATSASFAAPQRGAAGAALIASPFSFKAEALGFKNVGEARVH